MYPRSANLIASRWALSVFAVASFVALLAASTARAETSADSGVPPVCASPDYDYWVSHVGDYDESIEGSSKSDIRLHVDYETGVGASLGCAFQSRQ
ncbi:MAG TPA: hypothetical protein VG816_08955 [Solirubrobacterales bacterium]|nr:hypothetical protein [Solirubrobacterales bacterium]